MAAAATSTAAAVGVFYIFRTITKTITRERAANVLSQTQRTNVNNRERARESAELPQPTRGGRLFHLIPVVIALSVVHAARVKCNLSVERASEQNHSICCHRRRSQQRRWRSQAAQANFCWVPFTSQSLTLPQSQSLCCCCCNMY